MKYIYWVRLVIVFFTTFLSIQSFGQNMYKISLLRAAPGELQALIESTSKEIRQLNEKEDNSYMLRHSQGDQWDLMIVVPIKSYSEYFSSETGQVFEKKYGSDDLKIVAWQQDAFVEGPSHGTIERYFSENNFFHIEMFLALPGKQNELKKEREMENTYLQETSRKPNLIFTKLNGFEYDILTIGAYESHLAYAKGGNQPQSIQENAAKKAGFKSAEDIGLYLRSLLSKHRDTLANKVKI